MRVRHVHPEGESWIDAQDSRVPFNQQDLNSSNVDLVLEVTVATNRRKGTA
jgi:hypothetical protein